jgi:hypothetical protein
MIPTTATRDVSWREGGAQIVISGIFKTLAVAVIWGIVEDGSS